VAKYALEIKPSAGKEMDALDNALFHRIDRKILALAEDPRPAGCKKLRGYRDHWRIESATGASFTPSMMPRSA